MGLTPAERERFEPLLGLDLSAVRVYADSSAASLAAVQRSHAFAYGSHVVLGSRAQHAPTDVRAHVLAHELVHVGQQAGPRRSFDPGFSQPARGPPALAHAPLSVQRLDEDDDSILPAWVSEAAGTVADVGAEAFETATELPGRAGEFALESAAAVVETLAPGLLGLLRGGAVGQIAELFCEGLDALVARYFAALGEFDLMSTIKSTFEGVKEDLDSLQDDLGKGASAALGAILGPLVKGLESWGRPLIEALQGAATTVNDLFFGVWDQLAVPALGFLESVGGAVWDGFSALVTEIWELSAPLRSVAKRAWDWLMETFGLAWNSTADVRTTLGEKASAAWTDFLATIEPIRTPLMVAGGILVLLSPLGPIVVLTEVIPPLWEKISWLWNNWNSEDILVRAQEALREDILPGVIGAVSGVAGALAGASAWLAGLVTRLSTALTGVLGAFGGIRCLAAVTAYLEGASAQFERLGAWANSEFEGLGPALQAVLAALVAIFRPILDFLVRLAMVAVSPGLLPIILTTAIWRLCPNEVKRPVITFVLDLLIAFVEAMPALFLALGPMAAIVKAGALGFLRHLRGADEEVDDTRIAVSDKLASLAGGGGLEFMAGFAFGLLHGVLDGIIDPFRLIFLLLRVMVLGAGVVGRALAPFVRQAVPSFAAVMAPTGATPTTAPPAPEAPVPVARGPPESAGGAEPLTEQGPTDAEVAAALSAGTAAELGTAGAEPDVDEAALEGEARAEAESAGATVGGLAGLLADAWAFIIAGAEQLGALIAGALVEFIMQPDFTLGRKLGFVAGFLLLQGLIIYFSAGGYAALKGVEPVLRQLLIYLLRFLDLGGEIMAVLGRALRPLKGVVLGGLGAIRGFMNRFAFARALVERIERVAARLFRFGDEAAEAGAGRVAGAADTGATRAVGETAEGAARESGERAAREALQAGEQRVAGKVDDAGEGALRSADEAGGKTLRDDAAKAGQMLQAKAFASAVAEANDRQDSSLPVLFGQLVLLVQARYRWIKRFYAQPTAPGHFRIGFEASPGVQFEDDYSPGPPISIEDMEKMLPGVSLHTPARKKGLQALNALPDADSHDLVNAWAKLAKKDPAAVEKAIIKLGQQDAKKVAALRAAEREAAEELAEDKAKREAVEELAEESSKLPEARAKGLTIKDKPTLRTRPGKGRGTIRGDRRLLGQRMKKQLGDPPWARDRKDWNAHHIFPVGLQNKPVFDKLVSTVGWDHHNPLLNGIQLPTTLRAAQESGLPVHQVTKEMVKEARRRKQIGEPIPPGVIRTLQGHPNLNEKVELELQALEKYLDDPYELERQVLRLGDRLRNEILHGGDPVNF